MNNDFNGAIYKIILNLDNPNNENLEKLNNYVNDYIIKQNNSENEIVDPVINEAKKMYNAGKKTPGVISVINIIRKNDERIYDLNSDARQRKNNYGYSIIILIISAAVLLGGLLALLLINLK